MIDEILSGSHVQKRYFHVKMHSGLDVFKIPASKLAYYQIANSKRGDEEYGLKQTSNYYYIILNYQITKHIWF